MVLLVDGFKLGNMLIAGTNCLNDNMSLINALNVFPVPDGDSGTNMFLTAYAGAKELENFSSGDAGYVAERFASGALGGARGNSGVILSQMFSGFSKSLAGKTTVDAAGFAVAFAVAYETMYKAVMDPKEGTILTVAKAVAETAANVGDGDVLQNLGLVYARAERVLGKTVDMLPELKRAGKIDAGAKGLVCFLGGMIDALKTDKAHALESPKKSETKFDGYFSQIETADILYAYCTEFTVALRPGADFRNGDFNDLVKKFGGFGVVGE